MTTKSHIFTSTRSDISAELKETEHSMHEMFVKDCIKFADKPAFICGMTGRTVTYKQSLGVAKRLAGYLFHKHNLRAKDVVGLMMPNTPEYVSVFQAIVSLGAIVSPMNSMYSAFEVEKQLKLGNCKLMISVSHFQPQVEEGIRLYGHNGGPTVPLLVLDKSEVMHPATVVEPVPESYDYKPSADDVVALPFSSGTTGLPKGVQLTNRNLVANILQMTAAVTAEGDSTTISVLPFFHIYGLVAILHHFIHRGGLQIVVPKFDMEPFLDLIDKYKPAYLFVAPPILVGCIKHPKTKTIDTSSVKVVISGAAPLGEEVQRMCEPLFPNACVAQGYGLTETSPVISVCPLDQKHYGSAGTLVGTTEIRVVKVDEETGTKVDLGPNEGEGELWVRGPQVMKGYLRDEDTQIVFPEPGWFRTGDLVKVDEHGLITVTDRIKELIKYKGYQVAPAELEALIQTHPAVQECIVIGVADKEEGAGNEVPLAHVVLKPGTAPEDKDKLAHEIRDFVDHKVAPYKKLRGGLKIVDSIPKSAAGKLLRRIVRDQENAAAAAKHPSH
jgi:4-coumarate--CoA ligase